MRGVINILIGRFFRGRAGRERAVPASRIRLTRGVQEIFRCLGAWKRPVIFVAPLVRAHDEYLHWLARGKLVLDALEQVVVPAKLPFVLRLLGSGTEIYIAHLGSGTGMSADDDDELLPFSRFIASAIGLNSLVIA